MWSHSLSFTWSFIRIKEVQRLQLMKGVNNGETTNDDVNVMKFVWGRMGPFGLRREE